MCSYGGSVSKKCTPNNLAFHMGYGGPPATCLASSKGVCEGMRIRHVSKSTHVDFFSGYFVNNILLLFYDKGFERGLYKKNM